MVAAIYDSERTHSVAVRILIWDVLAVLLVVFCHRAELSVPSQYVGDLLGGKVALIGLLAAVATFHFGEWRRIAKEQLFDINEPRWRAWDRWLAVHSIPLTSDTQRARQIVTWHRWRLDTASTMASDTPHQETLLGHLIAAIYFLILSLTAELSGMPLKPSSDLSRAIVLGALLASGPPLIAAWARYSIGAAREFSAWKNAFQSAADHSKERLAGVPAENRAAGAAAKEGGES